ncbi:MAG: PhoH family protein [Planctomycetota bacterium]
MEVSIPLATRDEALTLFGLGDRNLKCLRDTFGVRIAARNNLIRLEGAPAPTEVAAQILNEVLLQHRNGFAVPEDFVDRECARRAIRADEGDADDGDVSPFGPASLSADGVDTTEANDAARDENGASSPSILLPGGPDTGDPSLPKKKPRPRGDDVPLSSAERSFAERLARTPGQASYIESLLKNQLVFCLGPAGTGKTFLAVNLAVHFLREGEIRRLILCRPAVEAGEKLGFLPGDLHAKINPYLRPLYDSLNDVLGYEQVKRYLEREIIEIVPLAYMRGRTLNNAFIILDEGQNTTVSQMKMFLTRMGANSRIAVNGDVTQLDLPRGQASGLVHAQRVLGRVKGVGWVHLKRPDIVRHPLVQRIVEAYESEDDRPPRREPAKIEEVKADDSASKTEGSSQPPKADSEAKTGGES